MGGSVCFTVPSAEDSSFMIVCLFPDRDRKMQTEAMIGDGWMMVYIR